MVDLDEFIVPRGEAAVQGGPGLLATAMARVRLPANKSAHAFLFSNSFFCSEFNNETAGPTFSIFDHPFRENIVWNYKLRAKMLVSSFAMSVCVLILCAGDDPGGDCGGPPQDPRLGAARRIAQQPRIIKSGTSAPLPLLPRGTRNLYKT